MSSRVRKQGLWLRIPLEAWLYVYATSVYVFYYTGSGLETVMPAVSKIHSFRLILKGDRPQALILQRKKKKMETDLLTGDTSNTAVGWPIL
jgi:hypothetical protein